MHQRSQASDGRERTRFLLNRMWVLFDMQCAGIFSISSFSPSPQVHNSWVTGEFRCTFHFVIWALGKEDSWIYHLRMYKKKKLPSCLLSQDVLCEFSIFKKFLSRG